MQTTRRGHTATRATTRRPPPQGRGSALRLPQNGTVSARQPGSRWCRRRQLPRELADGVGVGPSNRIASDRRRSSRARERMPRDPSSGLLRKEVIQPHLPVRLPCYDFTPIADPTFDGSLPRVGPPASGVTNFRGVTGGVYKARERIHRSNADLRLLATPTSRSRVADCDPN